MKKSHLATDYYRRLIKTESELGKERRAREKAEEEVKLLEKELERLKKEKEELEEENEQLKESRKVLAKMLFKGRTKKNPGKPRGGKIGHRGFSRFLPKTVTETVDLTLDACEHCHAPFSGCKRKYSRTVEDLVIQTELKVTRYLIRQYECKNCGRKSSSSSKEFIGRSPFGKKVFATILLYRYRANVPLSKIAEILKELHGLSVSSSGIQKILEMAASEFGGKYEQLKELIKSGKIIHADETHWRVNGQNWWTWLIGTNEATVFATEDSRGHGVAKKLLDGHSGVLVRDGLDSYNSVPGEQQICWVHLLRKAHEYCERERASNEMKRLKDILKADYEEMTTWHKEIHSEKERLRWHEKWKKIFIKIGKEKWKKEDSKTFIKEWIVQHENRLVTFLKDEGAPPENNPGERSIRPIVVFRKVTGGSRSPLGARITDINMSIMETWKKQGLPLLESLPIFAPSL